MKRINPFPRWLAAIGLALVAPVASASCVLDITDGNTLPQSIYVNFGNVVTTSGTGRLATVQLSLPARTYLCQSNPSRPTYNYAADVLFGLSDLIGSGQWSPKDFPTLIPGLVVRLFGPDGRQLNYLGHRVTCSRGQLCTLPAMTARAELWKVTAGNIAGGPIFPSNNTVANRMTVIYFGTSVGENFGSGSQLFNIIGSGGNIVPGTCSTQTTSITQTLADVSMNLMTGVGWAPARFEAMPQITLNCPYSGIAVRASLTDQTTPSNNGNVLTVRSGAGAATGVGLQIARSATGPAIAMQQPWSFTGSAPTTTVQLFTRYYQTADRPTAGSVTGRATLTLTYN